MVVMLDKCGYDEVGCGTDVVIGAERGAERMDDKMLLDKFQDVSVTVG